MTNTANGISINIPNTNGLKNAPTTPSDSSATTEMRFKSLHSKKLSKNVVKSL